jgi:hypothetical protein
LKIAFLNWEVILSGTQKSLAEKRRSEPNPRELLF